MELPEVESFRRLLAKCACGQRVDDVIVVDPGVLRNTGAAALRRIMRGRIIGEPARHGKWLMTPIDGPCLVFHFGMTGELVWVADGHRHPHDRLIVRFGQGELCYRDQRKLKGIWLARDADEVCRIVGSLGPDALAVTAAQLRRLLEGRRAGLRAAMTDQAVIAGLGILLADEILWQARLHPRRVAASLDATEHARLYAAMRHVLRVSVRDGHVPPRPDWLTGARILKTPLCPRCGGLLVRERVGGRSSYHCPRCQPAPAPGSADKVARSTGTGPSTIR